MTGPGGVPLAAPPLPGPAVFDQQWRDLAFLHWPIDPVAVAPFFPPGARPDLLDGVTYVGLVPFRMRRAGPGHVPVPYVGDFLETNVRLYSVDDDDRHGVLFRSLESSRLATVLLARLGLRLPYTWARMRERVAHDTRTWSSTRRWPDRGPSTRIALRVGDEVRPTAVEQFLTCRWGMHSQAYGHSLWTPNQHGDWPLHAAELLALDDGLMPAAGVEVGDARMLRPLFSPGVHTVFGAPVRLTQRRRVAVRAVRTVRRRVPHATPS